MGVPLMWGGNAMLSTTVSFPFRRPFWKVFSNMTLFSKTKLLRSFLHSNLGPRTHFSLLFLSPFFCPKVAGFRTPRKHTLRAM